MNDAPSGCRSRRRVKSSAAHVLIRQTDSIVPEDAGVWWV